MRYLAVGDSLIVHVYVVHRSPNIQPYPSLTCSYDAMKVGFFWLIELEISTTANPSPGYAKMVQLVRQALRGTFDYGDTDCYVILRRNLRKFVSAWLSQTPCAVKVGPCVRTGCAQHLWPTRNLVILVER